jgi:hypothetical protein
LDRTEKLKTYLTTLLENACSNVFYENSTDDAPYPYIVYSLEHVKDEDKYNYDLEVHVWDKSISSKLVESISDNVEFTLDGEYYTDSNQSLTLGLDTRISVPDQDKSLKHRRLLFDLQYYWKEG